MESPKPLDLDLMKDLEDMIYLKTDLSSGYGKPGGSNGGAGGAWNSQPPAGPPINRHVSFCLLILVALLSFIMSRISF